MDSERIRRPLCMKDISFAAAENRAGTGPGVGRKTCARKWIAQRKCSQDSANAVIVIDFFSSKNRDRRILEDIKNIFVGIQGESLNTHSKVTMEYVFNIADAA